MSCPFGPSFPGWSFRVEAFYADGRTYGAMNYGDEVYGDEDGRAGGPAWRDVTQPAFQASVTIGALTPTPPVPVNELVLDVRDDAGLWFDFTEPDRWTKPWINTPIRVSLVDPTSRAWILFAGRIETIADQHTKPPRIVTVTAYGYTSSLVTSRAGWQRPAEAADVRVAALFATTPSVPFAGTYPPGVPAGLLADAAPSVITVRDELDRTAASAGWLMVETPDGVVQVLAWPVAAAAITPLKVTDCIEADNADALLSGDVLYVADTASILNRAEQTNTAGAIARTTDDTSIAVFGERSQAFGFPTTGLAFASSATAQAVTDRAVARWKTITAHVDAINVDTAADGRWLAQLARMTLGHPITLDRRGVRPYTLNLLTTGWTINLRRDRADAIIYTTTLTG